MNLDRLLPSLLTLGLLAALSACNDSQVGSNNSAPEATIELPSVGTEVLEGREVTFRGAVEDRGTAVLELEVRWTSSIDGELSADAADGEGVTEFSTRDLTAGTHTVTLLVRDGAGASDEDTVELLVRPNEPPGITIQSPTTEGVYYSNLPVTLQATVTDLEDVPENLRITWAIVGGSTLAADLAPDSTGASTTSTTMAQGTYLLVATATDTSERTATATVTIGVGPPNTPPTCEIVSPESGSSTPVGDLVILEGFVSDIDVPADYLEVSFSSSVDGPLGDALASSSGEVALPTSSLGSGTHSITMNVADEVGGTCSDFIILTMSNPPTAIISTPAGNETFNDTDTIALAGTVQDNEDASNTLGAEWSSNLDGSLGASSPDSAGAVARSVSGLSPGAHLLTLTATDSMGLTGTDTVAVDINASPTAPTVSISPASPANDDSLTVNLDTPSTDPDAGPAPIVYTYSWTRNGNPMPAFAGQISIAAADTSTTDTWAVEVTATDGLATSAAGSASVTVVNSPPTIGSVTITPSVGLSTSIFSCSPSGWYDADGDSESYSYEWYAGGTSIAGASSSTYTPTGQLAGTQLTCAVTPTDSGGSGGSVSSGPAVINTPPVVTGVSISPGAATETTTLTAGYSGTSDVDGQSVSVSIQWNSGGVPIAGATGSTLDGASFDAGDVITVTVTPNDTLEDGSPGISGSVTIANTAPNISGASIGPIIGTAATTFTCVPSGWSDVDGASAGYLFQWYADAGLIVGATSASYLAAGQVAGAELTCEATPTDGVLSGTPVLSSPYTINTPPAVSGVSISPSVATELTTLTAGSSGTTDVDGQLVTISWQWRLGGVPIAGATSATLDGSSFDKGDAISVTATPNDTLEDGSAVTSAAVTIANSLPSISAVAIGPTSGDVTATFSCNPVGWSDADGDSAGYAYQWTVNSSTAGTTQTISGSSLSAGDVLVCIATPDDGEAPGTPATSAPVTVSSTPPSITSVAISPASGTEATTFGCVPSGWFDLDGDLPAYTWQWTVAGVASVTTQSIDGASFNRGDILACTATPVDASSTGTPRTSVPLTVQNTAPVISGVSISPSAGTETTTFACVPSGWTDPDPADATPAYTWQWTVAGVTSVTTQNIDGASFDRGDVLGCTATPTDGLATGSPLSSGPVTVANTPPSISSVAINPSTGYGTTTFTCVPSGWSDPDPADATPAYAWQWTVNGALSVTTQSIDGVSFDGGDTLACTATPLDVGSSGVPVASGAIAVSNTAPSISSVSISPTTGTETTIFTCAPSGWSDADGDPVGSYTYQWAVGGVASVTTGTISGSSFNKGDLLTCAATPFDGTSFGSPVGSGVVTVQNTPPSISSVGINPSAGTETSTFTCVPAGWSDPDPADATPAYTWQWTVAAAPSVTTQSISGGNFNQGDSLVCAATPTDGETPGSPVSSAAVVVANTPPTMTSVTITPSTAYTNTTLTATPSGWFDADGDPPSYMFDWFAGSTSVGTDSSTLAGSEFSKGQLISVEATPIDASSSGASVTSSGVTILNTPPTAPTVSITPAAPTYADALTCAATGSADPDNDTITYSYVWLVDGSPSGDTTAVLPSSATSPTEVWTCEATPNDGQVNGSMADDAVTVSTLVINWSSYWSHPLSVQPAGSSVLSYGSYSAQTVTVVGGVPCWRQYSQGTTSSGAATVLEIDPITPSTDFIAYEVDAFMYNTPYAGEAEFYPRTTSYSASTTYDDNTSHLRHTQADFVDIVTLSGRDDATGVEEVLDWYSGAPWDSWYTIRVEINLAADTATWFEDGVELGTYPVASGYTAGEYIALRTIRPSGGGYALSCWSNLRIYAGTPGP